MRRPAGFEEKPHDQISPKCHVETMTFHMEGVGRVRCRYRPLISLYQGIA